MDGSAKRSLRFDRARQLYARRTEKSWHSVPHISYVYRPDVTALCAAYRARQAAGAVPSFFAVVLRVLAQGVACAPALNARLAFLPRLVRGTLTRQKRIDADVVSLGCDGAVRFATVADAAEKTPAALDAALAGAADAAGRRADLYAGRGSVTVLDLGNMPGEAQMLTIAAPQICQFGVGRTRRVVRARTDAEGKETCEARSILPITICIDHRALDFGELKPFFARVEELFAAPELLF